MNSRIQILLGDNPFNGVDHFSQERSRVRKILQDDDVMDIVSAAMDSGASGFTFSTTPRMLSLLRRMGGTGLPKRMGLFPVIPDIQSYFQLVSEKGMMGALLEKLSDMNASSRVRSLVTGGYGLATQDPKRILKTYLKAETTIVENSLPSGASVNSVILHEIVTDLMVSLKMHSMFEAYCQTVRKSMNTVPGFVTRNFPRFVEFMRRDSSTMRECFVLTPFNSLGFQMNPNKTDCENALNDAKGMTVIAMSILAGGFLDLKDAVRYLSTLPSTVSCAVGVSSVAHAKETFSYLRSNLG